MVVCDIIPRTKYTSSVLDKIPPLFYPFSSKIEYV
jgi:hypothetical protein